MKEIYTMTKWGLGQQDRFIIQKSITAINMLKYKNHIFTYINVAKALKIQHTFMIKTLSKLGLEGKFCTMIKSIPQMSTANIYQMVKD